eukprot:GDKJ01058084.1.p1 GENE.GDKJ01058084.1~~GDKJ01058084.1.p1  ORF type:complete len:235 (-),score=30.89 GDKJ01058084.1:288-992(-)
MSDSSDSIVPDSSKFRYSLFDCFSDAEIFSQELMCSPCIHIYLGYQMNELNPIFCSHITTFCVPCLYSPLYRCVVRRVFKMPNAFLEDALTGFFCCICSNVQMNLEIRDFLNCSQARRVNSNMLEKPKQLTISTTPTEEVFIPKSRSPLLEKTSFVVPKKQILFTAPSGSYQPEPIFTFVAESNNPITVVPPSPIFANEILNQEFARKSYNKYLVQMHLENHQKERESLKKGGK